MSLEIRERLPSDDAWVVEALSSLWGSPWVVSRGRGHHADRLPGLVALRGERPVGLLTYRVDGCELEVVTLQAMERRSGVGSSLLARVRQVAERAGCRRLWLVTTNDNAPAIAFYGTVGWELATIHRGAMAESRRLKPEIPELGLGGIPIEDELEFELRL